VCKNTAEIRKLQPKCPPVAAKDDFGDRRTTAQHFHFLKINATDHSPLRGCCNSDMNGAGVW
jgi:hypothetical protein